MFSSIVHISPTTSLVVGTNPPAHPQWHDAVLDLHAHEYTAVHTRGQHPFSPFHISLLCVFMCIVGTWNMLLFNVNQVLSYFVQSGQEFALSLLYCLN